MDLILANWPADLPVPLLHPPPATLDEMRDRLRHNNVAWAWQFAPELLQAHLATAPEPRRTTP